MEREPEIAKLSHIALATPDFEKSLWFWRDLIGLEEIERVDGTVYLRGWGEFEHHSLSLRPDSAATVDHVAWRTARPEDVDAFAERIEGQGIPVHWVDEEQERGQGRAFRFHSMPGQVFEIFYDVEKPPAPEGRPSRLLNQPHRLEGRGVAPRRIDHVNMHAASGAEATKWLQDTFGFKLREYIVDGEGKMTSAWLSVTPLVHDIAVSDSPTGDPGLFNHVAYWVDNWQDVFRAADLVMEHQIAFFGPGRHGISQACFLYLLDPGSGHRLEIFSGSYLIFDPDWEPIRWTPEDLSIGLVWWGPKRSRIPANHATPSGKLPEPIGQTL